MDWKADFAEELKQFLRSEQFLVDAPMSEHTTFKIGGKADVLIFPSSIEEVIAIFKLTSERQLPCTFLGNGSNVLVLDGGIRGVVMKFNGEFAKLTRDGCKLTAGAGAKLKDVAMFAAENGLSGLEFAIGIPGSIGGAIFMNAGAYGGEMKNVVSVVRAVSRDGRCVELRGNELDLGYRRSVFQSNEQAICEVVLELEEGDPEQINRTMDDYTQRRKSKQPLEYPSAGSTFKRPKGHFAGTLIEQTGLKGLRIGGAMVSDKHAGFVVNAGGAKAADVLKLIEEVKRRVFETYAVKLTPEVRIIGEATDNA